MVVKGLHYFFNRSDNELILCLAVVVDDEVEWAPFLLNFLHLRFYLPLTSCTSRNLFNGLLAIHDTEGKQLSQTHRLACHHRLFQFVIDFLPVLVFKVFVGDWDDDGHKVDYTLNASLVCLQYAIAALFGEVGNADFELEDSELELLHFLLDIFWVEVADVRFLPSLL